MKSKKVVKPYTQVSAFPILPEEVKRLHEKQLDLLDADALQRQCKKIANARLIQPTERIKQEQVCLVTTIQRGAEVDNLVGFYADNLALYTKTYAENAHKLGHDETIEMLYKMETYLEKLQILVKVRTQSEVNQKLPEPKWEYK